MLKKIDSAISILCASYHRFYSHSLLKTNKPFCDTPCQFGAFLFNAPGAPYACLNMRCKGKNAAH